MRSASFRHARATAALLCAVASLAGATACSRRPDREVDLVIVAGQSNAVGYDADPAALPPDETDREVMFWWRCGDAPPDDQDSTSAGKWTHLQAQPRGRPERARGNFASPEGGFGPEIGLARTLGTGDRKLAIVKAAWNGTALRRDWSPGGGASYRSLLDEVRLAREAAAAQGITLRPRALVWLQGEADSVPQEVRLYEEALASMLAKLREELGAPDLPLLLGVNVHFGDVRKVRPRMATIVAAQRAVAARLGAGAYVDTEGASLANGSHFDAAGTLEVGRRFGEALRALERSRGADR